MKMEKKDVPASSEPAREPITITVRDPNTGELKKEGEYSHGPDKKDSPRDKD